MPVSPVVSSNDNYLESGQKRPTSDHISSCILGITTFSMHAPKEPAKLALDLLLIITDAPDVFAGSCADTQQYSEPNGES